MQKPIKFTDYLTQESLVLATAESCTAGNIMATLIKEGNCGDCLFIGYIVYSKTSKMKELNVKNSTIKKHNLTSEAVAAEMLEGLFKHTEINAAITTTGITGLTAVDGIPPGTVCFAWGFKQTEGIKQFTATKRFKGSTEEMIQLASEYALNNLIHYHQTIKDRND